MAETQLSITAEERECLVGILEEALKETRIEEHRTRTPSYRQHIVRHEEAIAAILAKLGRPAS
jgi:hypothetical protein